MHTLTNRFILLVIISLAIVACQPTTEEALPTQIDLDAISTENAIGTLTALPTVTSTSRPTLPPTFTPTAILTQTPEPTATSIPPTSEQSQLGNITGNIYYVYNGDSIAVARADGSLNDIILTFGVGMQISDLTLSPDGSLIAFIGPGSGIAREVYVTNSTGGYLQQISCLDFRDVRDLVWTNDGASLTFIAAPEQNMPANIFSANVDGANDCPSGNNQVELVSVNSTDLIGLAWNADNSILFYGSNEALQAYDVTLDTSIQFTNSSGIGPDFSVTHSPLEDRLAYLKTLQDRTGQIGGAVTLIQDTTFIPDRPYGITGTPYNATSISWSSQGDYLLILTQDDVIISQAQTGSITTLTNGALTSPTASISPSSEYVAYTTIDTNGIEQISIYDIDTQNVTMLTSNPEGMIDEILWVDSN